MPISIVKQDPRVIIPFDFQNLDETCLRNNNLLSLCMYRDYTNNTMYKIKTTLDDYCVLHTIKYYIIIIINYI